MRRRLSTSFACSNRLPGLELLFEGMHQCWQLCDLSHIGFPHLSMQLHARGCELSKKADVRGELPHDRWRPLLLPWAGRQVLVRDHAFQRSVQFGMRLDGKHTVETHIPAALA